MQVVYHAEIRLIGNFPLLVILNKRCNACLEFKDFDAYGVAKIMQDGMKSICRQCRKDPDVKSFSAKLVASPDSKFCTKCLQEKPYSDFNKMQKGEDGYCWYCKQCQSDYNHDLRIENIDEVRIKARVKNAKPETKAQRMKRHHERSDTDPHYIELRHQRGQRYYQGHVIDHRERYYRYQARKLEATVEKVDYNRILERDNWICHICKKPIDSNAKSRSAQSLDFDHVVPLNPRPGEPQGTHSEDNLKMSHKACNVRKSNKPMWDLSDRDRRGPRLQ